MTEKKRKFWYSAGKSCGEMSIKAAGAAVVLFLIGGICEMVVDFSDRREEKKNNKNNK